MAAEQQKLAIPVPPGLNADERFAIGDAVIDFIIDRTEKGKMANGRPFKKYSKEYIKSLEFEIAGKKKTPVNLTLSGDMLAAIQVLRNKRNEVVIGFRKGSEENAKAEGNQTGSYGQPSPQPKFARPFLDIAKKHLAAIIKETANDIPNAKILEFLRRQDKEKDGR